MKAIFGTKNMSVEESFYTYPLSNVHEELYITGPHLLGR